MPVLTTPSVAYEHARATMKQEEQSTTREVAPLDIVYCSPVSTQSNSKKPTLQHSSRSWLKSPILHSGGDESSSTLLTVPTVASASNADDESSSLQSRSTISRSTSLQSRSTIQSKSKKNTDDVSVGSKSILSNNVNQSKSRETADDESVGSKSVLSNNAVPNKNGEIVDDQIVGSRSLLSRSTLSKSRRLSSLEYIARRQQRLEKLKSSRSLHGTSDTSQSSRKQQGKFERASSGLDLRLLERRRSRSKTETQLQNLGTEHQYDSTPSKSQRDPIEPVVYDDLRAELMSAYETIQAQRELLNRKAGTPRGRVSKVLSDVQCNSQCENANDTIADLRRQIAELKQKIAELRQKRAESELALRHRVTIESIENKKSIDHWKREANCWQQRFDSAWADHEAKIARLQFESTEWRRQALRGLKRGTSCTAVELIRAKERIAELEQKLPPIEPGSNEKHQAALLESAMKQRQPHRRRFLRFRAFSK